VYDENMESKVGETPEELIARIKEDPVAWASERANMQERYIRAQAATMFLRPFAHGDSIEVTGELETAQAALEEAASLFKVEKSNKMTLNPKVIITKL
jgi:hypothetical protein